MAKDGRCWPWHKPVNHQEWNCRANSSCEVLSRASLTRLQAETTTLPQSKYVHTKESSRREVLQSHARLDRIAPEHRPLTLVPLGSAALQPASKHLGFGCPFVSKCVQPLATRFGIYLTTYTRISASVMPMTTFAVSL